MQKHILFIKNLIAHIMSVFTGLRVIVNNQFGENEWDFLHPEPDCCALL